MVLPCTRPLKSPSPRVPATRTDAPLCSPYNAGKLLKLKAESDGSIAETMKGNVKGRNKYRMHGIV